MQDAFWSLINLIIVIKSYTICPLVKFAIGYALFTAGATLITILYKLRYQVFNRDLKLQPAQCRNRVVVITGAGSGIGLAVARYLHTRGFVIVACCYSSEEPGYKELRELGDTRDDDGQESMHLLELDVQSQASIDACHAFVKKLLEENESLKLHALMNIAGVGVFQRFQWTTRETIRNTVGINLVGPMLMTRQFLHLLLKSPGARVVNVASPLGIIPTEMSSVYGPTKAALTHFSGALEADTARYGLRTVTIQPGNLIRNTSIINTSLVGKLDGVTMELNDHERALYGAEMGEHLKLMHQVECAHNKGHYNLELSTSRSLKSNLNRLTMLASGALSELQLNESKSFVQSFDNALRLKNPPREMFVGNIFYVIFADALLQWLSRTILRDVYLNIYIYLKRTEARRK